MRVLIGCESSGIVREAFRRRGHDAWSCDIKPTEIPGQHLECDLLSVLGDGWDLMVCHPDCTYLSNSGIHWNCRTPGRAKKTREAIEFAETLWAASIDRIALENPMGVLPTFSELMKCSQVIQPYEFGDDASKATCLWLKNLPPLKATRYVEPRMVNGKPRWANQTDSGQNKLGPSPTRKTDRSRTYQGIADAMAQQWSEAWLAVANEKGRDGSQHAARQRSLLLFE
jgi:hypothetical protein